MPEAKLTYYGSVKQGELKLPRRLKSEVVAAFEGKTIELTVRKKKNRRSIDQNSWYWLVLNFLLPYFKQLDPVGNAFLTAETIHDFFKDRFLSGYQRDFVISKDGETGKARQTTKTLTTTDFSAYIENINEFSNEYFGTAIPFPDEQMSFAGLKQTT